MARHALAAPTRLRQARKIATSVTMNVLALLGVVCIVLVVLAFTAKITLIMFQTGSMSPGIPAGSVAVVQQIPAAEIAVGDVVTVDRTGDLPVTHRVTGISEDGDLSSTTRVITMRGDANDVDDPLPYTVETVRKVLFSVAGVAPVIVWFAQPLVLGTITIAAGALVMVAFWPKKQAQAQTPVRKHSRPKSSSPKLPGSTLMLASLIGVVIGFHPAGLAHAAEQVTVTEKTAVVLTTIADPELMNGMMPNTPVYWQVGIQPKFVNTTSIVVEAAAEGDLHLGMQIRALVCPQRWVDAACPVAPRAMVSVGPEIVGTGYFPVAESEESEVWVLFEAIIPEGGFGTVTLSARITSLITDPKHPDASQTHVEVLSQSVPLEADLSTTGHRTPAWLPLLGLLSLVCGLTLAGIAKLRQIYVAQRTPID